jgi:hypothetical protein
MTNLTMTDIQGFAKTLEAIRQSKAIPNRIKTTLAQTFDEIRELDKSGDTDPLSPRFVSLWPPSS